MTETGVRRLGAALALAGAGVALYIAITEAGGGAPACVAGGHGCQTVADSEYSQLAGINVSVIGIAGYAMLLACFVVRGDAGRFAGLLAGLIGWGFSLYLTYLELFVIDAICQWCVASAVIMTALLAVAILRVVRFAGDEIGPAPQVIGDE
jgi:uncharacterized membrane protein